MSGRSAIIATDLASCVLPVPAGPSISSGLPSRAARLPTPAILSSARYPAAARPARTDAVSANTPATSSAWVTWAPPELSAACPPYCAVTGGALSSRRIPPPQVRPSGRPARRRRHEAGLPRLLSAALGREVIVSGPLSAAAAEEHVIADGQATVARRPDRVEGGV